MKVFMVILAVAVSITVGVKIGQWIYPHKSSYQTPSADEMLDRLNKHNANRRELRRVLDQVRTGGQKYSGEDFYSVVVDPNNSGSDFVDTILDNHPELDEALDDMFDELFPDIAG